MSGIEITGEHTTAEIKTTEVDETTVDQVSELVEHPAFRNEVKIMPDAHAGAGAVIGFTMALDDRVVPNTVGVDIGCGMTAVQLGDTDIVRHQLETTPESLDEKIRYNVPFGRHTFGDGDHPQQDYHIVNDFPWETCERKLESLNRHLDQEIPSPGYGKDYFLDVCERAGYDPQRAINSLGTLGGGNHFIEVAESEEFGDYWVVIHSGSRGIGLNIAKHWQSRASELRQADRVRDYFHDLNPDFLRYVKFDVDAATDEEIIDWVRGGMGEDFVDYEALKCEYKDLEPERIGEISDQLKGVLDVFVDDGSESLDWLEGDERVGYIQDMIFAQTYAHESRREMCKEVASVFGADIIDWVNSTHNYIDFDDQVIRKGATRVHEDEIAVIPFNMRDGSIIVRGKGNDDWNRSAPHGAGRRGSRRWAFEEFDLESFEEEMKGVYSTSVVEDTIDEAPMAYKDRDVVLDRIGETAEVVDVLEPVMNLKATE